MTVFSKLEHYPTEDWWASYGTDRRYSFHFQDILMVSVIKPQDRLCEIRIAFENPEHLHGSREKIH